MELCSVGKLDVVAIRAMLEKNEETETLEKLITAVLAYLEKYSEKEPINSDFFKGLDITPERLEKLGTYSNVLTYLIRLRIVDLSTFKSLALKVCDMTDLCEWCRGGLLDSNEFLSSTLKRHGLYQAVAASLDQSLPKVDYPLLLQNIAEAWTGKPLFSNMELSAFPRIFLEIGYTPYHVEIARYLVAYQQMHEDRDIIKIMFTVISHFCDLPNILDVLPEREDIVTLFIAARSYLSDPNYRSHENVQEKANKLKEQIISRITKEKQYSYLALYDYLFPLNDLKYDLVNEWATTGNDLAFSLYSGYLLNEKKNYMKEGKALDQRYLELSRENKTTWQRLRTKPKDESDDVNEGE